MATDLRNTVILGFLFLVLFGIGEILYHKFHVKGEVTRKFVHVMTGLLTMLFLILINNPWLVLLLCTGFLIILVASIRFNLIKSINAIDRRSYGSITYPIAVFGCYLVFNYHRDDHYYHHYYSPYHIFYLPILILAFCDPIAALVGRKWPYGKIKNKTIAGSAAFFVTAFILALIVDCTPINALLIAFASTIAEAVTPHGLDNLTIPASVLLVLLL